uniref:LOW QUALITY PROTEIN: acyl-coenzyme A thioesterase 1-like n=1 Tax=Monopterus albus TaxID=43700 RepID=UPI0009B4B190
LRKINVLTPYTVQISLLEGHVSPSEAQGTELATVTTERWYIAPGVRRIDIRQNGVVGTLFLPPGPGPFPAMLDLWGMSGGLTEYRAALIASRGYASLALAFLGHKDLPGPRNTMNVGDSYFKVG